MWHNALCLLSPEYAGKNSPFEWRNSYFRITKILVCLTFTNNARMEPPTLRPLVKSIITTKITNLHRANLMNLDITTYPHHSQGSICRQTCGGGGRLLTSKPTCLNVALVYFHTCLYSSHKNEMLWNQNTRMTSHCYISCVTTELLSELEGEEMVSVIPIWKKHWAKSPKLGKRQEN